MFSVLVPVLAQVVVLGASDRTEARLESERGERMLVGATTPAAQLSIEGDFMRFAVGYGPTFTLRPLDSEPRELIVEHAAGGEASLFFTHRRRRTVFRFTEQAIVQLRNPRADLLAAQPTTPGLAPTPDTGTDPPDDGSAAPPPGPTAPALPPDQRLAPDQLIFLGTLTTTFGVLREVSARTTVDTSVAHHVSMGLDRSSRREYPLVLGESAAVGVNHSLTRRDDLSATVTLSHAVPQNDDTWAWVGVGTGEWDHRLSRRTGTTLSAGLSTSYTRDRTGLEAISVYPTFGAGIQHTRMFARGPLGLSLTVSSTPVLDYTRATVDPQLGVTGAVAWARDRTTVYASVGSAISLEDDEQSFNSITANAGVSYEIGAGFSADTGLRAAWQTYGEETRVPPSWAVFIGLTWDGAVTLYSDR
jgi:hypothetical protein